MRFFLTFITTVLISIGSLMYFCMRFFPDTESETWGFWHTFGIAIAGVIVFVIYMAIVALVVGFIFRVDWRNIGE